MISKFVNKQLPVLGLDESLKEKVEAKVKKIESKCSKHTVKYISELCQMLL